MWNHDFSVITDNTFKLSVSEKTKKPNMECLRVFYMLKHTQPYQIQVNLSKNISSHLLRAVINKYFDYFSASISIRIEVVVGAKDKVLATYTEDCRKTLYVPVHCSA